MTYRLFYIIAGLLLMFTTMTAIFIVGAMNDPNAESFLGYGTMFVFLLIAMLVFLQLGRVYRKRQMSLYARAIDTQLRNTGIIDASQVARLAQVSLDSAREHLDTMAASHDWVRTETGGYNATYRPMYDGTP
ncbi:MAG: hypothetical protein MUC47_02670 [Candidatus Kapabacteria bacterium]|jgi:hypothetical protein|nr:hypothetical protein [Candidatus Kapabacteria bacterium]